MINQVVLIMYVQFANMDLIVITIVLITFNNIKNKKESKINIIMIYKNNFNKLR